MYRYYSSFVFILCGKDNEYNRLFINVNIFNVLINIVSADRRLPIMSELVKYELRDSVAIITMDDGKVNIMSIAMLQALHDAFEKAFQESSAIVLTGREGVFSAGFDLTVFTQGAKALLSMLTLGARLAERVMSSPVPVITACNGNCLPMGAFLMLSADYRIGALGDAKIGLNEVEIGLTMPQFAIEIARHRLTPSYFNRSVITAEMFNPIQAIEAGFLDEVVEVKNLLPKSLNVAARLAGLNKKAFRETKMKARSNSLDALREAIESELTLDKVTRATSGQ